MKATYIKPESKYLTLNGQVVMFGGMGDEEGFGSAMTNEASFEEEETQEEALPKAASVWE